MITYTIPAGYECSVCRSDDEDRQWMRHVTKKDVVAIEKPGGDSGAIVLECDGWLILTRLDRLKDLTAKGRLF